jgi:hypothetical protein
MVIRLLDVEGAPRPLLVFAPARGAVTRGLVNALSAKIGEIANERRALAKEQAMKNPTTPEGASKFINERIAELDDWRGRTFARVRELIHAADPGIVEEIKWRGVPVFSHAGIVCTGEIYKTAVKLTFAKGAALKDPSGLFNSSLEGNIRRAIDIHENEKINEPALKALIHEAVQLNLAAKSSTHLEPTSKPNPKSRSKR